MKTRTGQRRMWRASWAQYRRLNAKGTNRPALSRRQRRNLWRADWQERNIPAGTVIED